MKTILGRLNINGTWMVALLLVPILFQSCVATYVPARTTTVVRREVVPPPWAPQYDNVEEVRYYYLPDVEMYYDVWEHEYIYLHSGNWVFTTAFPGYYSDYDVNTAFVVVLNRNVHEPWKVHQTYVSHYPRYYYRSVYENNRRVAPGRTYSDVRGFNENVRTPIYRNQQPVNLGNSRDNTRPSRNTYDTRESKRPEERREATSRSNNDERSYNRRETNMNSNSNTNNDQPSRREVNRTDNNNNNNNNNEHRNYTHRADNQQNTDNNNNAEHRNPTTRNENQQNTNNSNSNSNTSNSNSSRSAETQQRTQPAVYTGKEVGQPVRVRREAKPAQEKKEVKEERSSSRKRDESSSESTNNRRR